MMSNLAELGVQVAEGWQGLGVQDPLGDVGGSPAHEQLLRHVVRVLVGLRG